MDETLLVERLYRIDASYNAKAGILELRIQAVDGHQLLCRDERRIITNAVCFLAPAEVEKVRTTDLALPLEFRVECVQSLDAARKLTRQIANRADGRFIDADLSVGWNSQESLLVGVTID